MIRFYIYLFYRFKTLHKYDDSDYNWFDGIIMFAGILLINISTIILFLHTILELDLVKHLHTGNGYYDKFVIGSLIGSPIFVFMYIFYRKNKLKIENYLLEFHNENKSQRKKGSKSVLLYIIITFLLLIGSLSSPIWIR